MNAWVNEHRRELVFAFIMFLVASISFGLGYLANREFNRAPIVIQEGAFAPKE